MFHQRPLPPTRPLSLAELKQRVQVHNNLQRLIGIVLIPLSLFAWSLTFAILYAVFAVPLGCMGAGPWLALIPAALGILALAGYGVWNARELLNRSDNDFISRVVDEGLLDSSLLHSHGFRMLGARMLVGAVAVGIVMEVAFSAPYTAVMSLQAFRSIISPDERLLDQACAIRRHLFENREQQRWMHISNFESSPQGLALLHRLKLIVIDEKDYMVRLES